MTLATETGNQDLVVFLDVVQATIPGHEGGDLLAVLDELHSDALADGGVRLLGFDADLFQHDSLGVGGSGERVGLPAGAQMGLLVVLIGPPLVPAVTDVLPSGTDSTWFTHSV